MERTISLVLSGGVALGAYQGGAYAALHERPERWPEYIAGSSIGAVSVLAWRRIGSVVALRAVGGQRSGFVPTCVSLLLALQTRMLGCLGVMRPRTLEVLLGNTLGLYDLSPLRARLVQTVDFERLNRGEVRLKVLTTDVESGEPVVFDTARGDAIGPDHHRELRLATGVSAGAD